MTNYAKIIAWKQKERKQFAEAIATKSKRRKRKKPATKKQKQTQTKIKNNPINAFGYPAEWTWSLRNEIRTTTGHRCDWCGDHEKDIGEPLHVHHKDRNKRNCKPSNLVPLCPDCHRLLAHNGFYSGLKGKELIAAIAHQDEHRKAWQKKSARMEQDIKEYEQFRRLVN